MPSPRLTANAGSSLHQRMGSLVKAGWCPQLTEGGGVKAGSTPRACERVLSKLLDSATRSQSKDPA